MANTTFRGVLRAGQPTGVPKKITVGRVIVSQRVTILHSTSGGAPVEVFLPPNSDLIAARIDVETPFAHAAGATAAALTFAVHPVSAASSIQLAVSGSARFDALAGAGVNRALIRNVPGTVQAHLSTQASTSALTIGQAIMTIEYAQGS